MSELKLGSGSIDPIQLGTYESVARVANDKDVPFIIVGASARDLVMHHGYGAPIQRATRDIDLAVQVPDWDSFNSICDSLTVEGYRKTDIPHRLRDASGIPLDIIPFGPLENCAAKISWPPDGAVVMDVLGFQEALEHCVWVKVDDIPELKLPVASPVGLGLLKLIAWSERDAQVRKKDAADLAYLAANYENIPGLRDELYENHVAVLESYGWDTRLSGAHVLGREVAIIASSSTLVSLRNRLNEDQAVKLKKDAETSLGASGSGVIVAFLAGLLDTRPIATTLIF